MQKILMEAIFKFHECTFAYPMKQHFLYDYNTFKKKLLNLENIWIMCLTGKLVVISEKILREMSRSNSKSPQCFFLSEKV